MPLIDNYHILVYGSQQGYQSTRAQIALYTGTNCVGYIRFVDPGVAFPADNMNTYNQIVMHVPSAIFHGVMDMLRNEKPINLYWAQNRGFLGTGALEPVGEGEA